jgi:ABC-type molybdate transport system permease subunit
MNALSIAFAVLSTVAAIMLWRIINIVLNYGEFKKEKYLESFIKLSALLFIVMIGFAVHFVMSCVCRVLLS